MFNFDVYLSFKNNHYFFRDTITVDPIWSEKNLTYNYAEHNDRHFNITLPVHEKIRNNQTLYLHMQITALNPFYNPSITNQQSLSEEQEGVPQIRVKPLQPYLKFNETIPLISY